MNYFLIPGNPPAVHFYETWGNEIKETIAHAQVRVSHYPLLDQFENSQLAMEHVLFEHLKQLRLFVEEVKSPVTVIGHSLGGHFALKLLETEGSLIKDVILLHPFLRRPQIQGQLILKFVGGLHRFLAVQKSIVKNRKRLEYFSKDLTHVTDEEIYKSFHIARHEGMTIGLNQDPIIIRDDLKNKIKVFYSKKDTWCSPHSIDELKQLVNVIECEEPHAFVSFKKHRKSLFNKISVAR